MNPKSHSGPMRSPGIFKHLSTPKMFQYIPDSALHGKFFTLLWEYRLNFRARCRILPGCENKQDTHIGWRRWEKKEENTVSQIENIPATEQGVQKTQANACCWDSDKSKRGRILREEYIARDCRWVRADHKAFFKYKTNQHSWETQEEVWDGFHDYLFQRSQGWKAEDRAGLMKLSM